MDSAFATQYLLPPPRISFGDKASNQSRLKSCVRSFPYRRPAPKRLFAGSDDENDCFTIHCPLSKTARLRAFDAFDPADLEDYSNLPTQDEKRMKRAMDLKARAKARLMPAMDPTQHRHRVQTRRYGTLDTLQRTPSPAPDAFYRPAFLPSTPKTPLRNIGVGFPHTPSTVVHSPDVTPLLPTRFWCATP